MNESYFTEIERIVFNQITEKFKFDWKAVENHLIGRLEYEWIE